MKIYKTKDINELFTKVVNKYLAKGYVFNLNTMSGSQGEIAKVDLTNGEHIYRINIDKEHDFENCIDTIKITVKEYETNKKRIDDIWITLWNNNGLLIECINFYEIDSKGYADAYTMDKEFSRECKEKRKTRFNYSYGSREIKVDKKKVCKNIVNNHKGYKSVRPSGIRGVFRNENIGYKIEFWAKNSIIVKTKNNKRGVKR